MEIKGKVTHVLPKETGVSKAGKDWSKQSIVIEIPGDYPKNVCFTLWGDKIPSPSIGEMITAHIDIESREYKERWYSEVKAWKIDTEANQVNQEVDVLDEDGLPF